MQTDTHIIRTLVKLRAQNTGTIKPLVSNIKFHGICWSFQRPLKKYTKYSGNQIGLNLKLKLS